MKNFDTEEGMIDCWVYVITAGMVIERKPCMFRSEVYHKKGLMLVLLCGIDDYEGSSENTQPLRRDAKTSQKHHWIQPRLC